ncbi:hypothetical protein IAQ61_000938 [Plenodomus lingam]|uniref:INO80 complex subunit Ies4 n=1 Tax=Leptosphaeria maculans (strain JN3 / isolate v23.1.3 / race Av1-4-5-6-7-8) TaxID=985895 RepID=E5A2T7_LEPMJ|nr:hypothetical protein LEMA_P092920.1 [Plenodomus lingam JN3]KAH9880644.1 hypothetical protein IAQ61_000938 [Plenodomus lingam]CBX97883.1 hypothetical protein LEMA_P092920.1 [Plenodomus lingam JN3]
MTAKPKSLVVTLKLPQSALTTFPHEPIAAPATESKPSSPPSDAPSITVDPMPADTSANSPAAMNGASTPSSLAPPVPEAEKTKAKKGPKPGSKRSSAVMEGSSASTPKPPRGKPGPKRKKMGDMLNDPNEKGPFAAPAPINKLGPKANMGIINQNLRNLDRTGKKCRRWEKRGFQVRSFTGVVWSVPSYQAPPRNSTFLEDVKSDSAGSSADSKMKEESSAISDSLPNGDGNTPVPTPLDGLASSPAPIPAA